MDKKHVLFNGLSLYRSLLTVVFILAAGLLGPDLALAQTKDVKVTVNGMVCSFCAQGITKKFKAQPSVEKVDVSLESKTVALKLKDGKELDNQTIEAILKDAGYNVAKIER